MQDVEVVGGFDKEIELRLLRDGYLIEYLPFAYVYDEKVQNAAVFPDKDVVGYQRSFIISASTFIRHLSHYLLQVILTISTKPYNICNCRGYFWQVFLLL